MRLFSIYFVISSAKKLILFIILGTLSLRGLWNKGSTVSYQRMTWDVFNVKISCHDNSYRSKCVMYCVCWPFEACNYFQLLSFSWRNAFKLAKYTLPIFKTIRRMGPERPFIQKIKTSIVIILKGPLHVLWSTFWDVALPWQLIH